MTAQGYVGGDPTKLSLTGGTMTGAIVLADGSPAASQQYVADHSGGGGGGAGIGAVDSGFITSGNITVGAGGWTQLGPDLTFPAAAGDLVDIIVELIADPSSAFLTLDAATRVSGVDTNWVSTGTSTSRFPGGLAPWVVNGSFFSGPRDPVRYKVLAGDVVAGQVTLRMYGQTDGSSVVVEANATFPFRWGLSDIGDGTP